MKIIDLLEKLFVSEKETNEMVNKFEESCHTHFTHFAEFDFGCQEEEDFKKIYHRSYNHCASCGAPLNNKKENCEYCGTYQPFDKIEMYEKPQPRITYPNQWITMPVVRRR